MTKTYVGMDVSKATFDMYCLPDERHECFQNTEAGIQKCLGKLASVEEALVVLEATGGYERELAVALQEAGFSVAIANPRRTRKFAEALGLSAKTDKIDARVIAKYAQTLEPPARGVLDDYRQQLKSLTARRHQLVKMHTAESNRKEHASGEVVVESIDAVLQFLEGELEKVEKEIERHIQKTPEFKQAHEILDSAPGIGPTTASVIIIEVPEIGTLNRRQIASLIGVAPFNKDSGAKKGKRMTSGGRALVRAKLYMPTVSATVHNPVIKRFYERLLANGKTKMTALIACMRKFITILNQMVKTNQHWSTKIEKTA